MLVSRDPYARTELHRFKTVSHTGCDNCGCKRTWKGRPTSVLFRYETQSDGGRTNRHKGSFCSKSCHDAYHS